MLPPFFIVSRILPTSHRAEAGWGYPGVTKSSGKTAEPLLASAAARISDASVKISEMMIASGVVIGARMGLMNAALRSPLDADYAELNRMVPEKVAAMSRAGAVWFDGACQLQRDLAEQFVDVGMLMLGGVPSAKRIAKLADDSSRRGTRALMFPVITGGAAMAPVHKTVTANARRLRGSKAA